MYIHATYGAQAWDLVLAYTLMIAHYLAEIGYRAKIVFADIAYNLALPPAQTDCSASGLPWTYKSNQEGRKTQSGIQAPCFADILKLSRKCVGFRPSAASVNVRELSRVGGSLV